MNTYNLPDSIVRSDKVHVVSSFRALTIVLQFLQLQPVCRYSLLRSLPFRGSLVLNFFPSEILQYFTLLQAIVIFAYLPADNTCNQLLHIGGRNRKVDG